MGYDTFIRLAVVKPKDPDYQKLQEYAKTHKLLCLEKCKFYGAQDYVRCISQEFSNLIFAMLYYGDDRELVYYIIHNGNITDGIGFDNMKDNYENKFDPDEDYDNHYEREIELCDACLIQKIDDLNMIDISELFKETDQQLFDDQQWDLSKLKNRWNDNIKKKYFWKSLRINE